MSTFSKRRTFGAGRTPRRTIFSLASAVLASSVLSACDAGTTTPDTDAAFALQLSASLLEMSTGDTARISVAQNVAGQRVTWTSDDPWIAVVDDGGLVAARKPGETVISVSNSKGRSTARVRVGRTTRPVTISPDQANLSAPGEEVRLKVTVLNNGGNIVSDPVVDWVSLDPRIATVDGAGIVFAQSGGTARVVAKVKDDADTATVTVADLSSKIASITMMPASTNLVVGDSLLVTATARDADGVEIPGISFDYSSSRSTVAKVNAAGVVRTQASGTAQITARLAAGSTNTVSGSAVVNVLEAKQSQVASVVLSQDAPTLNVNQQVQLVAIVKDDRGTVLSGASVTWKSVDANVAIVDTYGKVFAKAAGVVMITAASGGKMDTATVTVRQESPGKAGAPVFVEDFSSYRDTQDMLADPRRVYSDAEDINSYFISLDTTTGYGGSSQSMKYTFKSQEQKGTTTGKDGYCGGNTIGRSIDLEDVTGGMVKEIWGEFYYKFSQNWTTVAPEEWGCTSNPDYKFIFGRVRNLNGGTNDAGRFGLLHGNSGRRWIFGYPGNMNDGIFGGANAEWDGQWHRVRLHMKVSSAPDVADGRSRLWVGDNLLYDSGPVIVNRSEIWGIALGKNRNQSAHEDMSVWWGQISLWDSNPGW